MARYIVMRPDTDCIAIGQANNIAEARIRTTEWWMAITTHQPHLRHAFLRVRLDRRRGYYVISSADGMALPPTAQGW